MSTVCAALFMIISEGGSEICRSRSRGAFSQAIAGFSSFHGISDKNCLLVFILVKGSVTISESTIIY